MEGCCAVPSCSVVSQLCDPMDCSPPGSSVNGDTPGKNTGVGCHAFLQEIFPTQESNPGLPHYRQILYCLSHQMVKNLPAMQETWFDLWVRKIPWRRKRLLNPVFLPGEFHGQRSLAGYSPCGQKEPDKTERLITAQA